MSTPAQGIKTPDAQSYWSLLILTVPNVLSSIIEPLAELVDTAFVGRLGLVELAGLSACNGIFSVSIWIFNFLTHVSSIELSHNRGAGNKEGAEGAIKISLSIAAAAGLLLAVLLLLLEPYLLIGLMGLSGEHLQAAEQYYVWRLLSLPFVLISAAGLGVIRGLGLVQRAFGLVALCTGINIALTALFLYLFEWGLAGVAAGTLIAYVVTAAAALSFLMRHHMANRLKGWLSWNRQIFSSFFAKSSNQFGRTLALSSTFLGATALVNHAGPVAAGAYQVSMQLWLLGAYVLDGLAMTAVVCGGYLHGAEQERSWADLSQKLTRMALAFGAVMTALYFAFPRLAALFTNQTPVLEAVGDVWWVIAIMQIPNSLSFIADGLLFSRGELSFVRKRMIEGVLLLFWPLAGLAILSPFATAKPEGMALLSVWLASAALNLYRLISGYYRIYQITTNHSARGRQADAK